MSGYNPAAFGLAQRLRRRELFGEVVAYDSKPDRRGNIKGRIIEGRIIEADDHDMHIAARIELSRLLGADGVPNFMVPDGYLEQAK